MSHKDWTNFGGQLKGKRAVSHGGISLEEVVVPFITIEE